MPVPVRRPSGSQEPASLSQQAYLNIRDRILRGELPLGAALSRRKLAAELGMSILPVAEALQRLEGEALVESRPRIGTRVCIPSEQDIRERYEVREALESQAARLFAQRAGPGDKAELRKMADHMDALFNRCSSGGANDPDFLYAVQSFHFQLHLRIAEIAGCRALYRAIETNQVLIFNWLFDAAARRPPLPPRSHRDLAAAICEGDEMKADQAMRNHIRYGLDNVVRAINPSDSGWKTRVRRIK